MNGLDTGLSTWNKINTKLKFPMVFVNSVCTVQWNNMEHIYIYIHYIASSTHSIYKWEYNDKK